MRLSLEHVTRRFAGVDDAPAIEDVSLSVDAGQVLCLLGPSGCGKSTTLRIAAGVERQDAGVVRLDGAVVSDDRAHASPEKRHVGLMFQDLALFPHLTILENIGFGLPRAERAARARAELTRVGLPAAAAERYPHELSGGEQQRVALARALAPKPRAMLLDEPFSSLDHRLRDAVRDEALKLMTESGAAVLLVTHDPDEALRMGDRIALMRAGRIVQIGAPYHVYNHPVDRRAAAFFSDVNIIHGVVRDRQTDTPFGRFLTPGLVDGADVEIIVRPQHLEIDEVEPEASAATGVAARAVVERARFMGAYSLVEARLVEARLVDGRAAARVAGVDGAEAPLIRVAQPGAFLPPSGAPIWLSLRRDRCFVFPCAVQSRVEWPYFSARGSQASGTAATGVAAPLQGHAAPAVAEPAAPRARATSVADAEAAQIAAAPPLSEGRASPGEALGRAAE